MYYSRLFNHFYEKQPQMNPQLAAGYSYAVSSGAMRYLDQFLSWYNSTYPKGIRYERIATCTPEETIRELTRSKHQRHQLDISKTDVYMVKIEYSHFGRPIPPIYTFLPRIGIGNNMLLGDTLYTICPVLSDAGISVDGKGNSRELFFRVSKAGMSFKRVLQGFYRDDNRVQVNILHSKLHNESKKMRRGKRMPGDAQPTNCFPILNYYVFAKYGLFATLEKYCDTTPIICHRRDIESLDSKILEEYSVCQSLRIKPFGVKYNTWIAPDICILVKKDAFTPLVQHIIASFYYIVEHYPERFNVEMIGTQDELDAWAYTLGKTIWKNDMVDGRILGEIDVHISSVATYLDNMSRTTLESCGIYCEDIYDFFIHLMDFEVEYFIKRDMADIGNKRLAVLGNHVMYDITAAFNNAYYELDKRARKSVLEDKDIYSILQDKVKLNLIDSLKSAKHGEARCISTPNDSILTNYSTVLVLQRKASGGKKDKGNTVEPSQLLHSSILEFGSINHITSSGLTGRDRLNPYCHIDSNGSFKHNPELDDLIRAVDDDLCS